MTYRMNAPLLRAMRQFVQARANSLFWKRATRLEVRSFERAVDLFLAHGRDIHHPEPRAAVSLGMLMVVSALFELVVMPQELGAWKGLLPKDDQVLKRELTRAFLSYLGVRARRSAPAGKKVPGRPSRSAT